MDSARPGPLDPAPTAPPRPSVVVVAFNEEDRIGECLEPVGSCDERVVVDAHSTDRTREIAAAPGACVIERDWAGYRSQKEFGVAAAAKHWVLCIDADERVSGELRAGGFRGIAGASMGRRTWFHGAPLRFGTAAPDRLTRLFDRRRGGWRGLLFAWRESGYVLEKYLRLRRLARANP
jgi:glycosyltransferase involved in cell wall biosynthesis